MAVIESAEIISSSGSSALDEAALNTAYKWQFLPAKNFTNRTRMVRMVRIKLERTDRIISRRVFHEVTRI